MMIRFNDGVEFDTSGPLRVASRHDGIYVVGDGMLIPVRDMADAEQTIAKFKKSERNKSHA